MHRDTRWDGASLTGCSFPCLFAGWRWSAQRRCEFCNELVPKAAFALGERACRKHRSSSSALHQPDSGNEADANLDSSVPLSPVTPSRKRSRSLKPWIKASASTRAARKSSVRAFATSMGCPLEELRPRVSAVSLLHLPGHTRKKMRTVPGLKIASEATISRLEEEIAITHGTATAQFKLGTYITDPRKLIRTLNIGGRPLVIVCDFGGGSTKLGVTYFDTRGIAHFVALVISEAKDNWVGLNSLKTPGVL